MYEFFLTLRSMCSLSSRMLFKMITDIPVSLDGKLFNQTKKAATLTKDEFLFAYNKEKRPNTTKVQ